MSKKVLEVKDLNKSYIKDKKKIEVLKGLSCEFSKGKFYAITGKSGSGKSTFLKCLASLVEVDSGTINYQDKNILEFNDKEVSDYRNKNIGIIFQEYNLLNFLDVYDNIISPLVISGEKTYENKNDEKVNDLISFVDLKERRSHYPNELSGGEEQRVAIARALVNDPDIILADEPTGSIDNENTKNVLELLKRISKDKCVIVVTHDDKVLKYADLIYKLEDGKLKKYEPKR